MPTYYRGPDVVVTDTQITRLTPIERTVPLRGLDRLTITERLGPHAVRVLAGTALLTPALLWFAGMAALLWDWRPAAAGALAAAAVGAAGWWTLRRFPSTHVLKGVRGGIEMELYAGTDAQTFFEVHRAVRQAVAG